MQLSELMNGDRLGATGDVEIRGLTADSRDVRPGYLFAALAGSQTDGARFIEDAVARGAVAVLAGSAVEGIPETVAGLRDANPRHRLAQMAANFYGRQPATVAAVTGTNGKSSVAAFTQQFWRAAGLTAASLGTLGLDAPTIKLTLAHTTPDAVTLHRILAEVAAAGVGYLVLEASSHGLDQCRLDGVDIIAGAFTNLSRDHLDYHPTQAAYFEAKMRLFEDVMAPGGHAVLNADADVYDAVSGRCHDAGHRILSYGRSGRDLRLLDCRPTATGQHLQLDIQGRRHAVELPLIGAFQAENLLCAMGLALATGVDLDFLLSHADQISSVPGRLQLAARHPGGAPIYVDYAHTPDALRTVLEAVRPHVIGKLVVIFGCGGDRDRGKRPQMGAISAALADRVVVTDDNPRGEDPAAIRAAAMAGADGAVEIGDRREAIRSAIAGLAAEDVLVIAGKGHEPGQIVGDRVLPFDDVTEARRAVGALGGRLS